PPCSSHTRWPPPAPPLGHPPSLPTGCSSASRPAEFPAAPPTPSVAAPCRARPAVTRCLRLALPPAALPAPPAWQRLHLLLRFLRAGTAGAVPPQAAPAHHPASWSRYPFALPPPKAAPANTAQWHGESPPP